MSAADPMQAIAEFIAKAIEDGRPFSLVEEAGNILKAHPDTDMTPEDIVDALFFEHMRRLLWS